MIDKLITEKALENLAGAGSFQRGNAYFFAGSVGPLPNRSASGPNSASALWRGSLRLLPIKRFHLALAVETCTTRLFFAA